ncbi:nuclear transport factor 2 family protein [Carboxylicivirga sp. N1Y90]|uniref:nuclear transport factor 2 family protein n=1 Tax=Carboxylicivirga fragile TaxID=3417571 RepID=UPI003D3409DB|nr:nuclear transport factor 2 family protein [Marinilabiliaceae bacterium N1Y90]
METLDLRIQNKVKVAPIKAVLDQMLKAQESKDLEAFTMSFSQDTDIVHFGTDIDEIWYNWSSFYEWMAEAIKTKTDLTITEKNTRIRLNATENTAWYSQLLDTCFETKGEPTRIEGFRHTGVLEKRDNKWLIVQSHMSIPYTSPNID